MSRDPRNNYYQRDHRDIRDRRDQGPSRGPNRDDYRSRPIKRSPSKRRSRSPRIKSEKDALDENILREISKLPEPSELWDNQHMDGFPAPLHSFPEGTSNAAFSGSVPNFPPPTGSNFGIYDDFPTMGGVNQPPPSGPPEWNQMSLPPPPPNFPHQGMEDQIKKEAAIESEMRHQKAALSKQREDYVRKSAVLKKELDTLKDQREELRGDPKRSPSPDSKRFLKENAKLQLEIQNKLKTINNVVDMLNGIIGEDAAPAPEPDKERRAPRRKSRSPTNKFNYVYYDPEMHWCRVCDEFPSTAKDYLNHLHSPAHHKMAAAHMEAPWHSLPGVNEGFASYPAAPTKRTPIRGLQFFVPSTAWYCKLCDQFIGDLHCASAHLKSVLHSKNYTNFVEQNPHWETDWMSDRQKAADKSRKAKATGSPYAAHTITFHKDGYHTKSAAKEQEREQEKEKEKKKKKDKRKRRKSSSSSSGESSSDSEKERKKKKKESDDKLFKEWMSSINSDRLSEGERKLLHSLKGRMRDKDDKPCEGRASRERDRERAIRGYADRKNNRQTAKNTDSPREPREAREPRSPREPRGPREDKPPPKKPEIKKMPFIGKMPVFKSLSKPPAKTAADEKTDAQKTDDDAAARKKREEMDAEIQKKVAEFKEKIAKAQMEREQSCLGDGLLPSPSFIPPPQVVVPSMPSMPNMSSMPNIPKLPNLPKDFQEALDIIFPSDNKGKKNEINTQDLFQGLQIPNFPGLPMPFPPHLMPGGMPQMPGGMQQMPQMPGMQQMPGMPGGPFVNFDLAPPVFRPQMFDGKQVPQQARRPQQKQKKNHQQKNQATLNGKPPSTTSSDRDDPAPAEDPGRRAELDEMALLGIDASDVAGM